MTHIFDNKLKVQRIWMGFALAVIFLFAGGASGSCYAEDSPQHFGYEDYALVLETYVDDNAMVNYRGLKSNREQLDAFVARLDKLQPEVYDAWDDDHKIAFWLNAYNGFTLKAIIEHYPIKASFLGGKRFPKNSIRQIKGVWNKLEFSVMGRKRTLEEIEHEILRKKFTEPRIHMALVCAAMGCPPLRNEPYTGSRLSEQLDDQTRRFLKNPLMFRLNRKKERVYISSIFKWFGKDFVSIYGANDKLKEYSETKRAVLSFMSRYLDKETQEYIASQELSVKHLDYDWSLNEQQPGT